MKKNHPRFTRQHFEFVADFFGPLMGHPSDINRMAEHLRDTNANFKEDRFVTRATQAWEDKHIKPMQDEQYDHDAMINGRLSNG